MLWKHFAERLEAESRDTHQEDVEETVTSSMNKKKKEEGTKPGGKLCDQSGLDSWWRF